MQPGSAKGKGGDAKPSKSPEPAATGEKTAKAAAEGKPAGHGGDGASGTATGGADAARAAEQEAARWGPVWPLVRGWRWSKSQLKELWTRYGWLTIITWFGMYNLVLWGLFASRRAGIFKGMDAKDVEAWINGLSLKDRLYGPEPVKLSPVAMDFLVAWLLVKTTEPIRAIAVVLTVPFLVRRLPTWLLFRLGAKNIPGRTGGPGL